VRRRLVDIVLVWRYDRFARSTQALINALNEFRTLGVDFISYQENIDTTTPQGELIFGIFASLAQFESALISERVKAGMARARAQGKPLGRPHIPEHIKDEIQQPSGGFCTVSCQTSLGYGTTKSLSGVTESNAPSHFVTKGGDREPRRSRLLAHRAGPA